jgi:hypothetical protein
LTENGKLTLPESALRIADELSEHLKPACQVCLHGSEVVERQAIQVDSGDVSRGYAEDRIKRFGALCVGPIIKVVDEELNRTRTKCGTNGQTGLNFQ